jgi:hypothetical protein
MEVPFKVSGVTPEIAVLLSNTKGDHYKNFRCVVCGKIVFSYDNTGIRMILPSGHPDTTRPGKVIECGNTMELHQPADAYDILYQVLQLLYTEDDVTKLREVAQQAAVDHAGALNIKCKARYYVS